MCGARSRSQDNLLTAEDFVSADQEPSGCARQRASRERIEHQLHAATPGVFGKHLRSHVRHPQVPAVHVVHQYSTVKGPGRIPAERLKLPGYVGDPALGDPAHGPRAAG